jgi:sulfur carrier protein ThiS
VFARSPEVQGYVLDDQGELRKHVAVYVDGRKISDRSRLSDPVNDTSEIWVLQALSGG